MRTLQKVSAVTFDHSKVDLGSTIIFEHSGVSPGLEEILGPVPKFDEIQNRQKRKDLDHPRCSVTQEGSMMELFTLGCKIIIPIVFVAVQKPKYKFLTGPVRDRSQISI